MKRYWQELSESIITLCNKILELWNVWNWKLNLFLFLLAHFAKTRHSPAFLHTPLEKSWQYLSESVFTFCKNILELWKLWNWKLNLFLQNLAFSRVLTYTVGKALARPFRINNHIVQKDLATMKCLELKVELVFVFLAHFAKTRNSAVF